MSLNRIDRVAIALATSLIMVGIVSCQTQPQSPEAALEMAAAVRSPDSASGSGDLEKLFPVETGFYEVTTGAQECVGGPVQWVKKDGATPLLTVGTKVGFTNINLPEKTEISPDKTCTTQLLTRVHRQRIVQRRIIDCNKPASYLVVIESLTLQGQRKLSYEVFHKNSNEEPARPVIKCGFAKKG